MAIDDKIKDEKLEYNIDREATKISVLSSGKTDRYEYVTGEGILPSNHSRITEQAKFTYSPLGRTFEKQIKTIEEQGKKQVKALILEPKENQELKKIEGLFLKNMRTDKVKKEIDEIRKWEEKIEKKNLIYKTNKYKYDFQQYETTGSFGGNIYTGKISIDEAEIDQTSLLRKIIRFNAFRSRIFPIKATQGKGVQILTPKQMLQRLPIAIDHIKAGSTSENLFNEIKQILYSLYRAREITENVYNNILNSAKV